MNRPCSAGGIFPVLIRVVARLTRFESSEDAPASMRVAEETAKTARRTSDPVREFFLTSQGGTPCAVVHTIRCAAQRLLIMGDSGSVRINRQGT